MLYILYILIYLSGKRVEIIAKKWDDIVSEAIYGQPSLILFEDLDYIASAPLSHEQENGPDGVYFSSVSQGTFNLLFFRQLQFIFELYIATFSSTK